MYRRMPADRVLSLACGRSQHEATLSTLTVSRFGLAVKLVNRKDRFSSIPLRLSFLFQKCDLCTRFVTSPLTVNKNIAHLSALHYHSGGGS